MTEIFLPMEAVQDANSEANLAGPPVSGGNVPVMTNKSLCT